ncbi:hypothetical protein BBJ28_00017378, partial [Nothophytophthora sp. Chile5]
VSNVEVLEGIPRSDVKRIANWHEIEVGDKVKVKEKGSCLYYEAEVMSQNSDGTFKVHFVEVDEEEDNIPADQMLKLMSGRLENKEWMMYKETDED